MKCSCLLVVSVGVFLSCFSGAYATDDLKMKNSSVSSQLPMYQRLEADVYATTDFIYWRAQQEGMEYAFNGSVGGGGITSQINAVKGKVYAPHFKYRPGFKVGLGGFVGEDRWDLFSQYTYLNVPRTSNQTSCTGNQTNNVLQGTNIYGYLGVSNTYTRATSGWGLNLNVLDLDLAKGFWVSSRFEIKPNIGMKFSWIRQELSTSGNVVINGALTASIMKYRFLLRQFGVGVRGGMQTNFRLWDQWVLFGDFDMTGLWNYYKSIRKDIYSPNSESSFVNLYTVLSSRSVTMVLETAVGLRFETIFGENTQYMYILQAAWESQVWFNQGQFVHCHVPSSPVNLSMQGLTVKTGFWF